MSIINKNETLAIALGNIEKNFRDKIIHSYLELKHRAFKAVYSKEYDSAGLAAGKFCEMLFRFLENELKGSHIAFNAHVANLAAEFSKLEQLPKTSGNESLRIIIPRALLLIYTLRNKRGIGHIGGDIEANGIDLSTIVKLSDWVIAELIRIYHKMSFEEAQSVVDSLNAKEIPTVWEINGKKRVLKNGIDYKDKILLILYSDINNSCAVEDLYDWTEYSNLSLFKSKLLQKMHKENLIEYDKKLEYAYLSPVGIKEVEKRLLTMNITLIS